MFPRLVKIGQSFPASGIPDIYKAVKETLEGVQYAQRIFPGQNVAITAGSRGIDRIDEVLFAIIKEIKHIGAQPFIVPAMGSHGGATAEGQVEVLRKLGITEERAGVPVKAAMEAVKIGVARSGISIYCDRFAKEADAIIVVNRIKPHSILRGDIQSGLLKMLAVGLGKRVQAEMLHSFGVEGLQEKILEAAEVMLQNLPVVIGIGLVENACDQLETVEAIPPLNFIARERELLIKSKQIMARLPFNDIDILVVDAMGKEISGTGMDPNVIGRRKLPGIEDHDFPRIKVIMVRDLTEASCGNANGVGLADVIPDRLFKKIDLQMTAANVLTTALLERGKIPLVLPTDQEALSAAVKACGTCSPGLIRLVRIRDTLQLTELLISEALLPEAREANLAILTSPFPVNFDQGGNLTGGWN